MTWARDGKNDDPRQSGTGPGFVRYSRDEFDHLRRQHNIMVLVGNGFDIQTLHDYEHPVDSRYETFFYYLQMRGFDPTNVLFQRMKNELLLHSSMAVTTTGVTSRRLSRGCSRRGMRPSRSSVTCARSRPSLPSSFRELRQAVYSVGSGRMLPRTSGAFGACPSSSATSSTATTSCHWAFLPGWPTTTCSTSSS